MKVKSKSLVTKNSFLETTFKAKKSKKIFKKRTVLGNPKRKASQRCKRKDGERSNTMI